MQWPGLTPVQFAKSNRFGTADIAHSPNAMISVIFKIYEEFRRRIERAEFFRVGRFVRDERGW